MKFSAIGITFYFFLIGCKSQNVTNNKCVNDLRQDLSTNWKLSSDSAYHLYNDSLTIRMDLDYKSCLKGMTKEDVVSLFGKPNKIESKNEDKVVYRYYVTPPCLNNDDCGYLLFNFNSNNIVETYFFLFQTFGSPK
jgi:hypothetical protein